MFTKEECLMAFHAPRVHGNGFIQLDISNERRLHVWGHPEIPRQNPPTPIHNHQFGFRSRILLGKLTNVSYREAFVSGLQYVPHLAQVRYNQDTVLSPSGSPITLIETKRITYSGAHEYTMEPGEIHESIADGLAVTIIEKTGQTLSQGGPPPTVYVPLGMEPDNSFDRYSFREELLWEIIGEALMKAKFPFIL